MSTKYKFILGILSISLLAAGCNSANNPAPVPSDQTQQQSPAPSATQNNPTPVVTTPNNPAPTPPSKNTIVCPATEHSCPCSTGNYCLFKGAMCINPTSACPVGKPTPTPAPTPVPTPSPTQPDSVSVTISNFAFSPANVTVQKGTKVIWTNRDSAPHTVTGNNGGPASGNLSTGASYGYTFNQTGTFPYHCSIHPSMTASITVTQ